MLLNDRLWIFPLSFALNDRSETRELVCPAFESLGDLHNIQVQLDSTILCLTMSTPSNQHDDPVLQLCKPLTRKEFLRAPSLECAEKWTQAVVALDTDRMGTDADNALIGALDAQIADYEYLQVKQFYGNIPTGEIEHSELALKMLLKQQ